MIYVAALAIMPGFLFSYAEREVQNFSYLCKSIRVKVSRLNFDLSGKITV